jgi:hypothetical protein
MCGKKFIDFIFRHFFKINKTEKRKNGKNGKTEKRKKRKKQQLLVTNHISKILKITEI